MVLFVLSVRLHTSFIHSKTSCKLIHNIKISSFCYTSSSHSTYNPVKLKKIKGHINKIVLIIKSADVKERQEIHFYIFFCRIRSNTGEVKELLSVIMNITRKLELKDHA